MAYPYPSAEGATSSSSLHNPVQGVFRGDISRKASEGDSDVLDAFKVCLVSSDEPDDVEEARRGRGVYQFLPG